VAAGHRKNGCEWRDLILIRLKFNPLYTTDRLISQIKDGFNKYGYLTFAYQYQPTFYWSGDNNFVTLCIFNFVFVKQILETKVRYPYLLNPSFIWDIRRSVVYNGLNFNLIKIRSLHSHPFFLCPAAT
jgi:hypothetical protein